ncbi:MAG: GNAT family N-acetyltransferase [Chloroflexota bacterium]
MSYSVTHESFATLDSLWRNPQNQLSWPSIFVLPAWMEVWWQEFRPDGELYLAIVRQESDIIGIAPLRLQGQQVSFIGSVDVCDYMDFVVVPGRERDFFDALLDDLKRNGIKHLKLEHLRPESSVLNTLVDMAEKRGYEVSYHEDAVSLELDLPATWEGYLAILNKKQRHEVERKLRRLRETDGVEYYCTNVTKQVDGFLDTFLQLFVLSQGEKADFMTEQKESFFRAIASAMASLGMLRFGTLEIDKSPVAMVMGFDYDGRMYLYNSAYNPDFSHLSAGLLSKVLCIQESIQQGLKKWDFLKGAEPYKYHLGGSAVPLYSCQITINES